MRGFSLVAIALFGVGCATLDPVPDSIKLISRFDAEEANAKLAPGPNTITGSALMRQQGGGIVTCAGTDIRLIPDTAYARERMTILYGSIEGGFQSIARGTSMPKFEPDEPLYMATSRTVTCDALGMFEIDAVADGEYFVVSRVTWDAGYAIQGGAMMRRVKVAGGQTKKVVLSP